MNPNFPSPLFRELPHPDTGVPHVLLETRVAPLQQSFYYVNDGASANGRFYWFYCAFPPSGDAAHGRTLGVVNLEDGSVSHFPETQFSHGSPWVEPETGWIYWGTGRAVWKRGPLPEDTAVKVGEVPQELIGMRTVNCTATHLTRSADKSEFFIDLRTPAKTYLGTMNIHTGVYSHWTELDGTWDHAQFHPTDPDLVLFSQEFHSDPITGRRIPCEDRMWLLRRGGKPEPVFAEPTICTHEWWSADGKSIYAIHGGEGTWKVDLATRKKEIVWPWGTWHSHSSRDDRLLVGDKNQKFSRGCEAWISLLDRTTGTEVAIGHNPAMHNDIGANYHIDPHPRFTFQDSCIAYTATFRGQLDLAFVKLDDLLS